MLNSNFSNYQPKGNYASSSHNHDDIYLRAYTAYIMDEFTEHDSYHYKWTFTAPAKGRYLFIVNFRPVGCQSSCRLKIDSTNYDAIGGVANVPEYAFSSFSATEPFNEGESKTLYFEIDKGCDPTIRLSIIKVDN